MKGQEMACILPQRGLSRLRVRLKTSRTGRPGYTPGGASGCGPEFYALPLLICRRCNHCSHRRSQPDMKWGA